jgi:hypothetical protein
VRRRRSCATVTGTVIAADGSRNRAGARSSGIGASRAARRSSQWARLYARPAARRRIE